jgi:hypothetical protein
MKHLMPGRAWLLFFGAFLLYMQSAHGADDAAEKARVALSYIDCDGDFTIRNGRIGLNLGGRFVADTILGATYLGAIRVWGGEDKRYTLLFSEDLSHATLAATSGGSTDAKCYPSPHWRKPPNMKPTLILQLASIWLNCLGTFLWFYHGDANRKFALSVRGVGLLDEEPENSPRRKAEKNNLRLERVGIGAIFVGIFLQVVSLFCQ